MHENFVKRYLCRQKTAIKKCSRLVGKLMYLNTISIYVNVKKNLKRTKKIFLQCKYIGGQKTNDIRVTFIDITVFDKDVSSHFVLSNIRGQFHQPYGAKHKCASSLFLCHSVSPTKLRPTLPKHSTRSYIQLLRCTLCAIRQ